MELGNHVIRIAQTSNGTSEISGQEIDENIRMALRAVSAGLGQSKETEVITDRAAEPFAKELSDWIREGLITAEGVEFSREEFRRRLEAEKIRYAGRAVASHICEAADQLERKVLGY